MRFRFRRFALLLLGTVLVSLLILLFTIQQRHNRNSSSSGLALLLNTDQRSANDRLAARDETRTNEDFEVRRLLLSSGSAEEETPASNRLEDASAEMAPALMSLFPVGRFPPAMRGNASGNELTLNLAIVLTVSLLSIAILITAICCVIIVALALDSPPARRWSAQPSLAHPSDLFLSSWPGMPSQYHRLNPSPVYRTPGLAKLFKQQQEQRQQREQQHNYLMLMVNDAPVDTPPLTDDEEYADDDDTVADGEHRLLLVQKGQCHWHQLRRNGHGTAPLRRNSFTCTSANISPN